jgi:hypothetical protein
MAPPRPYRSAFGVVYAFTTAALAQPANDAWTSAQPLSGFGSVVTFDTTAATADGPPYSLCNQGELAQIDHDVWFCWTPPASGPVRLACCTPTTTNTRIAVYQGCTSPQFNSPLACSDDAWGPLPTAWWVASSDQTYLIRVGSYPGALGGPGCFTISSGLVAGPVVSPVTGHSYSVLSPSSWSIGERMANAMGGHLARIRSPQDNEFIRSLLAAGVRPGWIGLQNGQTPGTHLWTDGAAFTYSNWAAGQPSTDDAARYTRIGSVDGLWSNDLDSGLTPVRLLLFAHRLYLEPCRCVVVGDSINAEAVDTNMPAGYFQRLRPVHWAGWTNAGYPCGSPASGVSQNPTGGLDPEIKGFGAAFGGEGGPPSGGSAEGAIWPAHFGDSGLWAANQAPGSTAWRFSFSAYARSLFNGGDWFSGAGVCRTVWYRGAAGLPALGYASVRPYPGGPESGSVASVSLPQGYSWQDTPLAPGAGDVATLVRYASPDIDEQNRNEYLLGVRWFIPGASGLEMSFAAVGGSAVQDHINPSRVSSAARTAMVNAFDLDTVIIWLGVNGTVDATWSANLQTLIDAWRQPILAAGRNPLFLLVANYEFSSPGKLREIAGYMRAIASANSDVSFYNLGAEAGSSAVVSHLYLRDGVHPNADGALYFAGLLDQALKRALDGVVFEQACPIVEISQLPCYANCDGSTVPPVLNISDFICFQARFAANDPLANCDGSVIPPVLNINDFICFTNAFAAGCP